ncbi:hypothetical protein VitviT2T_001288 [Vitis vinifera]|uniref:Uncharacterized protein n=1 Tax=Vitis vinifera TaxID=29760 RepID=A0ABY9BF86_VITVI|nr:hypothetical protein VitviT2T_001288 [Vitis vinifera]
MASKNFLWRNSTFFPQFGSNPMLQHGFAWNMNAFTQYARTFRLFQIKATFTVHRISNRRDRKEAVFI